MAAHPAPPSAAPASPHGEDGFPPSSCPQRAGRSNPTMVRTAHSAASGMRSGASLILRHGRWQCHRGVPIKSVRPPLPKDRLAAAVIPPPSTAARHRASSHGRVNLGLEHTGRLDLWRLGLQGRRVHVDRRTIGLRRWGRWCVRRCCKRRSQGSGASGGFAGAAGDVSILDTAPAFDQAETRFGTITLPQ
jgi:hypothetical protein